MADGYSCISKAGDGPTERLLVVTVNMFLSPPERYCCLSVAVPADSTTVEPNGQTPADLATSTCLLLSPKNILLLSVVPFEMVLVCIIEVTEFISDRSLIEKSEPSSVNVCIE